MKRIVSMLAACFVLSVATISTSQAQVHVNVNIGSQPLWGPTGYDNVDYYYLPDLEMYYYVPQHQFIYQSNGRWVYTNNLPPRYRNFDLYSAHKVVVNGPKPYMHFDQDRRNYARFRGERGRQEVIRDSRDPKYFVVKGHPHYNERGRGDEHGHDHDDHGRH